ncbi:FMN-binding negative transcriptional regulator [bacterium]|nr:FMN-binding negative transcriptional regulator [bacterium]
MYLPAAFHETDLATIHAFIELHSFGLLTSQGDELPLGTHLPFLLDRTTGPQGTLIGHMAKANPHWRYADGETVMVVFHGPHAYITPTWYAAENVVPTWNYVAVHAYGVFELVDDDETLDIVAQTVERYEQPQAQPWKFERDTDFARKLLAAIVGFRIEVTRLEGKWKLSQNHSLERRERVIAGLQQQGDADAVAIAALMAATLPSAK